jgi:hypothetical protein
MSESKKPVGIVLIALYSGFCGLAFVPIGCTSMLVGQTPSGGTMAVMVGIVFVVLGFLLLASVYGLWTIQPWGRNLTSWIYVASIPLGVISIFPVFTGQKMTVGNVLLQLLGIAVDLIVLGYLAKPEIKQMFGSAIEKSGPGEYTRREPR